MDDQLLNACKNNNTKEVKELLKNGANVNAEGAKINILLDSWNNPDANSIFEIFYFSEGFPGEDYNFRIRLSALMIAAQNGHTEIVKLLIENDAKVNQINRENKTALHLASKNGHKEVVQVLINNGAKVNKVDEKESFFYLWDKLWFNKSMRMRLLNVKYYKDGNTALHLASENNHKEVVQILGDYENDFKNIKKQVNNGSLPSSQSSTNSNDMRL